MTGSLKKKKGGCSVIRACSLIRSNTVLCIITLFINIHKKETESRLTYIPLMQCVCFCQHKLPYST